ncbi:MAG: SRPBCC family protein [Thiobacillaceae bacterium]
MTRRLRLLLLACALCWGMSQAAEGPTDAVAVAVAREGEHLLITAEFRVPVDIRTVWAVLTDFEHMAGFLPGLKESQVLAQTGDRLTVQQKGETTAGLLSMEYESVRAVELTPYRSIRSRTLKGSRGIVEGETRLTPEGRDGTRISYTAQAQPDSTLASLVPTRYVREELRTQFHAMREEMLRRARLQLGRTASAPIGG